MKSLLAVAMLATLMGAAAVRAETVDFTFQSDTFNLGTVTGVIEGLTNGAAVVPTDVIITSAPVTGISYAFDLDPATFTYSGSFSVVNGVVTGADFVASDGTVAFGLGDSFVNNGFGFIGTQDAAENFDGFPGATYTAAVPEPAAWGLMFLGVGLLGAGLRVNRGKIVLAIS